MYLSFQMMLKDTNQKRIESIDVLRGIVMVIMALDHVRDYFHVTANVDNPLNLATTTPALYFTRWITHFCAPVFAFLSGTSIYLQSLKKTKKELSSFLIKRGLWLIFAEIVIIAFAWTFNPFYNFIPLQVIWAIGISMVILGLIIHLPFYLVLALGMLIVFGHNMLDAAEASPDYQPGFWKDLLHHGFFSLYQFAPNHFVAIVYPFLPWTGLMMLGYCAGVYFVPHFSAVRRKQMLMLIGVSLIVLFIALRYFNIYGNPRPWSDQSNPMLNFFSFMDVQKYPPSLLYLCATIGPALILLALLENIKNGFTAFIRTFGRVAFFYYVLHIYLIHLIAVICFFAKGHSMEDAIRSAPTLPFMFVIPGEGYSLPVVYLIWLLVVLLLYPLCRKYDRYKSSHKDKWWLSYI